MVGVLCWVGASVSLELGNSSRWKESVIVEEKLKQSAANLGLICLSTQQQSKTYTHANIDLGEELPPED